jgi:ATP-dependent helicase HrpB
MAELGVHPRIAHMMLCAKVRRMGGLACDIAAILSERDMMRGRHGDCDLQHRLTILNGARPDGAECDPDQVSRIRRASLDWRRQLGEGKTHPRNVEAAGRLLALAYPDRLAQRRGATGQFRLANGRGATIDAIDPLSKQEFLAIGSLDGDKRAARVFLAAPISQAEIEEDFASDIHEADLIAWNPRSEAVEAKRERRLWALVLQEKSLKKADPGKVLSAMLEGVRAMGLECLPWSDEARAFQARVAFVGSLEGEAKNWPDLSDGALMQDLETWLSPRLAGVTRRQHLAAVDLLGALRSRLDWRQLKRLDEWAPTHLNVPSGSRVMLDYGAGPPVLRVRLQEMFGASETPRVAGGRVEIVLHLLSPARRPVQVTRDLAGFWANSYRAVRADLRGQYPRHYWPDDPLVAEPTARAKPRGR